jgi:hypothetical protein
MYYAEQMQGKPGLQIYCAVQIQEKLDCSCTVLCGTDSEKVGRLMYCTVLTRCRESLDCKCTVRKSFRKSWTAYVLCGTDAGKAWTANVLGGTDSGKVRRLMFCTVLNRCRESLDCKCTVRNRFRKS